MPMWWSGTRRSHQDHLGHNPEVRSSTTTCSKGIEVTAQARYTLSRGEVDLVRTAKNIDPASAGPRHASSNAANPSPAVNEALAKLEGDSRPRAKSCNATRRIFQAGV